MHWNIAEAKQNLSDVVRHAASEPQLICNRGREVAVLVDADTFRAFQAWREPVPAVLRWAEMVGSATLSVVTVEEFITA